MPDIMPGIIPGNIPGVPAGILARANSASPAAFGTNANTLPLATSDVPVASFAAVMAVPTATPTVSAADLAMVTNTCDAVLVGLTGFKTRMTDAPWLVMAVIRNVQATPAIAPLIGVWLWPDAVTPPAGATMTARLASAAEPAALVTPCALALN